MRHDNLVYLSTPEAWRAWLHAHHASETEVWLTYAKKHTGKPRIAYQRAVDEALCFGWIDSTTHRVDDVYYAQRFTPRRPKSEWSDLNRRRFRALVKAGRMTAAGLERGPRRRTGAEQAKVRARRAADSRVPGFMTKALARHPRARETFERMPPGKRRLLVGWIDSAKRDETKQRRLKEAVSLLARNLPLGMK